MKLSHVLAGGLALTFAAAGFAAGRDSTGRQVPPAASSPHTREAAQVPTVRVAVHRGRGGNGFPEDDYPSQWRDIAQDSVFDNWGEYNRECTSFVAWALASRNGFTMPFYDNASQWGFRAERLGFQVDDQPAVGAVGWSSGHVVWAEAVSGSTVTIQEYNNDWHGHFNRRDVPASAFRWIHFKDIPAPAAVPTVAQPPAVSAGSAIQGSSPVLQGGSTPQRTGGDLQPAAAPPGPAGGHGSVQGTQGGSGAGSASAPAATQPPSPPAEAPPAQPSTYAEQSWKYGSPTFQNHHNASGEGQRIAVGEWVQVTCKVYDPSIQSASPGGYWYLIASSPWNNAYWAVANTFVNGDPWDGPYSHPYDPAVRDC